MLERKAEILLSRHVQCLKQWSTATMLVGDLNTRRSTDEQIAVLGNDFVKHARNPLQIKGHQVPKTSTTPYSGAVVYWSGTVA